MSEVRRSAVLRGDLVEWRVPVRHVLLLDVHRPDKVVDMPPEMRGRLVDMFETTYHAEPTGTWQPVIVAIRPEAGRDNQ